ncbi:hypothetical protein V3C99_000916 [Haemonchus contortus]
MPCRHCYEISQVRAALPPSVQSCPVRNPKQSTMPKGRRLTSTEQCQILLLRQAGHSNKTIAEQHGRSRRCIDGFVKNAAAYGQAHGGGRPLKLTRADHRLIARLASNSTMSANQIRARLSLNVSTSTVLRAIRRQIFLRRERMKLAPRLTRSHREARLEFAREISSRNWRKVIFSDEKKFNLGGPDGYVHYRRDLRSTIFAKRVFGGGTAMIWAAFSPYGTLDLEFISTHMNSQEHQDIFQRSLLAYLHDHRRKRLVFQQDNAPAHISR